MRQLAGSSFSSQIYVSERYQSIIDSTAREAPSRARDEDRLLAHRFIQNYVRSWHSRWSRFIPRCLVMDMHDIEWIVDGQPVACPTAFAYSESRTLVCMPIEIGLIGDAYWPDRQLLETERRHYAAQQLE